MSLPSTLIKRLARLPQASWHAHSHTHNLARPFPISSLHTSPSSLGIDLAHPLHTSWHAPILARPLHTSPPSPADTDLGVPTPDTRQRLFTNTFHNLFRLTPKTELRRSAYLLASHATQNVDIIPFLEELKLPDSYYSWFLVSELHIWLYMVRLNGGDFDTKQAKLVRNLVVHFLWEEATERAKRLGGVSMSHRKEKLSDLNEEFSVALILYDAGIMGDDMDLANAVWRRFMQGKPDPDMDQVAMLVNYVRKTSAHLETKPIGDVLTDEKFEWFPLKE